MECINVNVLVVVQFLKVYDKVVWVCYVGLVDDFEYVVVQCYLGGYGLGVLIFGLLGGCEVGVCFFDVLKLFICLVNLGDVKLLVIYLVLIIYWQLDVVELVKVGVSEDIVWLLIGIEYIGDLCVDLEQVLVVV